MFRLDGMPERGQTSRGRPVGGFRAQVVLMFWGFDPELRGI